ncbi:3-hydroxyacyl-ACP dehydratase FabZ [Hyphococcus luteus]|uniref:3-hydroxyacyl-[acyl-carrier-protein] dehydratase FabZ n=1 Tax=Hyphococcus luteus TaxID=2058213 RepID=A0A2S7JYQ8_9PROT|nr:3-hydroxyacyl-ACP dehydratase FabZ [Marinicaulis flavus]PQA85384.1 3-hydroxyacyl-[acyl-carrier-protein] dehydratase FabZ [Marinicaulis flavus]
MSKVEPGKSVLNVEELMQILPHRYPLLLVDRLVDIVPGEGAVGIKNVSYGEQFFQGHFPQKPVMPGVLIIEAMAQSAAAYTSYTENLDVEGKVVLFMGVDKARFRRPVVPGDQLRIAVRTVQRRPPVWRFEGEATVDGKRVAEAQFSAMLAQAI